MSDLIERLKHFARGGFGPINDACAQAIDEIERLRDAKRRALTVADERVKENCALRSTRNALREARDFIEDSSFNVLPKERFYATLETIDAALTSNVPKFPGRDVVAWRWRHANSKHWVYDPSPEWREDFKDDPAVVFEPLYAENVL